MLTCWALFAVFMQLANNHQILHTKVDATAQYRSLYGFDEETGMYHWAPQGLKVFEKDIVEDGSDVAAVKGGHVSITALRTGYRSA